MDVAGARPVAVPPLVGVRLPPAPVAGPRRRGIDVVLALLGLLVLAPVMVVVAVLVRVTSPGPVLFRQVRVGQFGQRFEMYKFRTMRTGCSDRLHREYVSRLMTDQACGTQGGLFKLGADPRVTRIGAVLRSWSLDELPQLFNVVRGDMALVGPRPMLPFEVELMQDRHRDRFTVPPGITGLWQISGRSMLTMPQALDLDVEYARSRSLGLDLRILAKTIPVVLGSAQEAR
jgi:lipopolysaccharide/colanic/teichoic acid biosynthesis glycosyltransferase